MRKSIWIVVVFVAVMMTAGGVYGQALEPISPSGGMVPLIDYPDLTCSSARPDDGVTSPPFYTEQIVNWHVTISNDGAGDSPDVDARVGYYLGTSTSDTTHRIGYDSFDDIPSGESITEHAGYAFTLDDIGTRYLNTFADYEDDIEEENETNNMNSYGPFHVHATTFAVNSPALGETLTGGSYYNVVWTTTGHCPSVKIDYQISGGPDWIAATPYTPNDGDFLWNVPNIDADSCRIKVSSLAYPGIIDVESEIFTMTERFSLIDLFVNVCGYEIQLSWEPVEYAEAYLVFRGDDPFAMERIDSLIVTSYLDMPYPIDTTYFYSVCALDETGDTIGSSAIEDAYPYPYRVRGFSYTLIEDNCVELSWNVSGIDSEYVLHYTEGIAFPPLWDTLNIVYAPENTWISPPGMLTLGETYTFAIYCRAKCGFIDINERVFLTVPVVNISYDSACRRVHIRNPLPGRKISGNCVMIMAMPNCPVGHPLNISAVLFQKAYMIGGEWTDITLLSVDSLEHPNPDITPPYFIHWNVDEELAGEYLIRAIAFDTLGNPDPAPAAIPIYIDDYRPECGSYFGVDSSRGVPAGHVYEYWERVYPHSAADINIGDFDDTEDWIHVPEGAIIENDVISCRMTNRDEEVGSYCSIGEFLELRLRSGASMLPAGFSIEFVLEYPDFDDDGIVDGTFIEEDSLWFFHFDGADWDSTDCTFEHDDNIITAYSNFWGRFAILSVYEEWIREIAQPGAVSLSVFPSPFNAAVSIAYSIALASDVSLEIYDIAGHRVAGIANEHQAPGMYAITWTAPDNAPSGIYLVRLKAGDRTIAKRATLIR